MTTLKKSYYGYGTSQNEVLDPSLIGSFNRHRKRACFTCCPRRFAITYGRFAPHATGTRETVNAIVIDRMCGISGSKRFPGIVAQ